MRTTQWNRLINAGPVLFLFILPFAHTTAVRSVAFVLTLLSAAYVWRTSSIPRIPLKIPLFVWTMVATASLFWAADPIYSAGEIKSEIVYAILIYAAFFALAGNTYALTTYVIGIFSSSAILSVIALWLFVSTGTLNSDNVIGGVLYYVTFLVTVLPVLLGVLTISSLSTKIRITLTILILLALVTGTLCLNRSFLPTVFVSSSVFGIFYLFRNRSNSLPSGRFAFMAIISFSLICAGFAWIAAQRTGQDGNWLKAIRSTIAGDPRPDIWKFSLDRISLEPWTGVGFGRMGQAEEFQSALGKPYVTHAHNIVLNYGVQMGIPGIASFLVLFGAIFRSLWRLSESANRQMRLIGITGMSVVVAILLKSMVDDLFVRHLAWLFWALLGIGLGYAARVNERETSSDESRRDFS